MSGSKMASTLSEIDMTEITDWSHTLKFSPKHIFRPTSIDELQHILVTNDGPFSMIGSLHSSSGNFVNTNSIIDLKLMPMKFSFSNDFSTFTASTNMTVRDTLLRLALADKALPATGGTDEQTLAGILGTNTAPASGTTSIYSGLISVRIVTIQGEGKDQKAIVQDINRDNPMFKAVVPNLGAIGVLVEATFKTSPNLYYHTVQETGNVDKVLKEFKYVDKSGNNYPFWRITWFPKSDQGLVWAARPIIPKGSADGEYPRDFATKILLKTAFSGHNSPFLNTTLHGLYEAAIVKYKVDPLIREGPMRNMLPVDRFSEQHLYCALAAFVFLPKDAPTARKIFIDYFSKHEWPNLPIETDPVKADDYYMSQWNFAKIDPSATHLVKFNIQYFTPPDMDEPHRGKFRQEIVDHVQGLWNELVKQELKFKSHWGKMNFTSPENIRELFNWNEFKGYVNKKFMNPYLHQRLPPLDS